MKRVIIKQFLHDGYVFNFTDEAVNSDKKIIGFYFDGLGFPQGIHRDSIFGSYIVGAKNTEQANQPDNGYVCNRPGQCAKGQGGKCYSGFDCPDKAIAG